MEVDMAGVHHTLNAGDVLPFSAHTPHTVTIGPEGCEYVVGEK